MRLQLIEKIREKIEDGSYENDLKLDIAVDRMLDSDFLEEKEVFPKLAE